MRPSGLILLCWAVALTAAASAAEQHVVSSDFPALLRSELASGQVDRATADLYWLYAIRAPERLPARYLLTEEAPAGAGRQAAAKPLVLRCATPFLRGVAGRLAAMPPTLRAEARTLLQVKFDEDGSAGRRAGRTAARESVLGLVESEHFALVWDPDTVTNADGTRPATDANGDKIPDTVQSWADYLEASYAEVTELLSPGNPGAVFAGTVLQGEKIAVAVEDLGAGAYGVTFAFADETTGQLLPPVMALNSNLSFAPENDVGAATGSPLQNALAAMKVTAAHEFFHVVQFVYYGADRLFFDPDFFDDWWMEESSTWMEDEVFDEVNDYIQFFTGTGDDREPDVGGGSSGSGGWADFVEEGLVIDVTTATASQVYGGVIFPKHISEHVAGQTSMGEIWDLIRGAPPDQPGLSAPDALDLFAQQVGFTGVGGTLPGLDGLYLGFAGVNTSLETQYEEGAKGYGEVPVRGGLPALDVTQDLPAALGSTYRAGGGQDAGLEVAIEDPTTAGDPSAIEDWGLSVAVRRAGQDFLLVLASSGLQEVPSTSLGLLGAADLATAAASFFSSGQPRPFSLTTAAVPAPDLTPPASPAAVEASVPAPDPGGALNVTWQAPAGETDLAGYVVRVTEATAQGTPFSQARVILYPLLGAEVRELPAGTYEVDVLAYDRSGNQSAFSAPTPGVTVAAATPTPTPAVPLELVREGISSSDVEDRKDSTRGIGTDYGLDKICFLGALGL